MMSDAVEMGHVEGVKVRFTALAVGLNRWRRWKNSKADSVGA